MEKSTRFSPQYDYSSLRGRIKQVCGTEGNFANRIGRTQNFLSNVFQGKSYFDAKDINASIDVLDIELPEIGTYFYTQKVCESETL